MKRFSVVAFHYFMTVHIIFYELADGVPVIDLSPGGDKKYTASSETKKFFHIRKVTAQLPALLQDVLVRNLRTGSWLLASIGKT